ncbi:MAG: phage tail tape measure protein, partial [Lentisphaeria bacterium]|nr:phage tail tape measure protein [Lentisphaeria bacterium]
MSTSLEKLTFSILLLDNLSKPAAGICRSLQKIQKLSSAGFSNIKLGVANMAGGAAALSGFVSPARDFEKAIGEVRSLGTLEGDLESLTAASKKFTNRFGGDATAFVRSAYDIQSAIPGLKKNALAAFTYSGNLLAKSTKADAATITKFQGTMYNIFEKSANRIGQAKWVEALTGKTAHAIKIFKSSGNDMSAAFTNLGSIGEKAGVSLDEQLAVLGQLQGTMGGANAGTAYKAFLNKVGKAKLTTRSGETLKFTDQSGKLLPMVQILEKIRKAVGPGQLKLADQTALMTAFGDEGGKAVLNLLDKTDSLKQSIGELGKIQ